MLEEEELKDTVLMVLANKQDISGCLTPPEIYKSLGLETLRNRSVQIFKVFFHIQISLFKKLILFDKMIIGFVLHSLLNLVICHKR